jgi:hypothetical protein
MTAHALSPLAGNDNADGADERTEQVVRQAHDVEAFAA